MDFTYESNRIVFTQDGKELAYVLFPTISEGVVKIQSTFVDPSLRGKGVAGQLMEALVKQLEANQWKANPTCSYAVEWFQRHPAYQHLLV